MSRFLSNCIDYRGLYTWFEAKKVCPIGLHLPSDREWNQLSDIFGGLDIAGNFFRGKGNHKRSNKSSFNATIGRMREDSNGIYYKVNTAGFYWSFIECKNDTDEASNWSFAIWSDKL